MTMLASFFRYVSFALMMIGSFAGCIGSTTYRSHAFVPLLRHYRVRYENGAESARRILPSSWSSSEDASTETISVAFDLDGDRDADIRGETPRQDLHYVHESGAVLFASTIPMGPRRARQPLAAIAHQLANGRFGRDFLASLGSLEVLQITSEYDARVGNAPAYCITFERAARNESRSELITIVLVRPHGLLWRDEGIANTENGAPMVITLVYRAPANVHAQLRGDFDALLDRLDVRPEVN
jgi:hypothetical protein